MPIDISKSLDDLLRELEWDKEEAVEIKFGDVAALRVNEYGHFNFFIGTKGIAMKTMHFAQFIGTKYDVAMFIETYLVLTKNPLMYLIENAFMWGNRRDKSKKIELECYFAPKGFLIIVKDEGNGFNTAEVVRKQDAGQKYYRKGGAAFSFMKEEQTCTYSYNKKGNEAYILCLTANMQRADKSKILETPFSPVYFPEILETKVRSEART
ncbi:TPA: ATP-binding protein [Candidatus Woesearchaeota archaeon]|nr:ATP-binding protein [Candidatus Woesearchaeota archaeon]